MYFLLENTCEIDKIQESWANVIRAHTCCGTFSDIRWDELFRRNPMAIPKAAVNSSTRCSMRWIAAAQGTWVKKKWGLSQSSRVPRTTGHLHSGCHITFAYTLAVKLLEVAKYVKATDITDRMKMNAYDPLDETGKMFYQLRFWWHSWAVAGGI